VAVSKGSSKLSLQNFAVWISRQLISDDHVRDFLLAT
jgi:hypothetical protein